MVDLDAIQHNVHRLHSAAPSAAVMAVVKADAYGHGMRQVAAASRLAGAEWLGLALPSEAVALRQAGDSGRLLAWLYAPGDDLDEALSRSVDLSVSSAWQLSAVASAAERCGTIGRIHLKIDTGLGRGGATSDEWHHLVGLAGAEEARGRIKVAGIWSHLACADIPDQTVTNAQCARFREALEVARQQGVTPEVRHIASSGATLFSPVSHFDMVRIGISLYGLSPGPGLGTPEELGLQPAMTLTAEIAHVKRVPAGHGVSYGLRYQTPRPTNLALVPVGYADGVPRNASGRLPVSINREHYPAVGTIAMDQFVVDVGEASVAPGDRALLFGAAADGAPTAQDWAAASDSIVNEIVTRIGGRVPRTYIGEAAQSI